MANIKATESICSACEGSIVEETTRVHDPRTGPMIIGPGSQNQFHEQTELYCEDCGLMYKFLPKE